MLARRLLRPVRGEMWRAPGAASVLLVLCVAAACTATAPPAPPPAPRATPAPVSVAPMYDMSHVPPRPVLTWPPHTRTVFRRDAVTGRDYFEAVRDTIVGETLPPDTNDARIYYSAGVGAFRADPAAASAALYWASKLDPSWADPYFARWYTLRAAAMRFQRPATDTNSANAAAKVWVHVDLPDTIRTRVDSLLLMAYVRNPFVDEFVYIDDVLENTRNSVHRFNINRVKALESVNLQRLDKGQPPLMGGDSAKMPQGWFMSYAERDWAGSAKMLAPLIKKYPDNIALYVYRAKAFFYLKQNDSCSAVLRAAIVRIQNMEAKRTLPLYLSKEMFTYSIAVSQMAAGHDSTARLAYEETVSENLGFFMAHVHLASAALQVGDTTTAITEALAATQIRPDDPLVQVFAGYPLLTARRQAEAVDHLEAALAADPYYAVAYMYSGQALNELNDTTRAVAAYHQYLVHARRDEVHRETVEAAISVLTSASNKTSGN